MASLIRDVLKTIVAMVIALGAVVVIVLIVALFSQFNLTPAPLTKGLPSDLAEANRTFNARVLGRFPVGTPEQALAEELGQEGFKQSDWGGVTGTEHVATRTDRRVALICTVEAEVFWLADAKARVAQIRGIYAQFCA